MNIREELQEIVEKRVSDITGIDMNDATVYQKRKVVNTSSLIVHDVMAAVTKQMSESGMAVKDIADIFGVKEATILNWKK